MQFHQHNCRFINTIAGSSTQLQVHQHNFRFINTIAVSSTQLHQHNCRFINRNCRLINTIAVSSAQLQVLKLFMTRKSTQMFVIFLGLILCYAEFKTVPIFATSLFVPKIWNIFFSQFCQQYLFIWKSIFMKKYLLYLKYFLGWI